MKKKNIIQFLPYFPPHKWGLETVAEEIWYYWNKENLGKCINVITNFEQKWEHDSNKNIIFQWENIGYIKNNIDHLVVPGFEIINNFPIYKFWTKKYKLIKRYLKDQIKNNQHNFRVITHTRFFFTSLIWGIFAKKNNIKRVHIEHGSDYVKLSSKIKNFIAYIYDRIFGNRIFHKTYILLAISEACRSFIHSKFIKREIWVFYRWLDMDIPNIKKIWDTQFIFIWRLVKLKWVDLLIKAYQNIKTQKKLIIIGDWEEKENLEILAKWENIEFLWFKNRDFIVEFLTKNNCILVNPSYQEWLPTTVLEWLLTSNVVVASNVWGTKEISQEKDLLLFDSWNKEDLQEKILFALKNYDNLKWKSKIHVEEKFSWENNIFKLYNFVK